MLSIIGRLEPPQGDGLSDVHKVVQIIARAIHGEVRTPFFRITRASVFYTLPTSRRMFVFAGAVAPQYPFAAIVYNIADTAIIISLKVSATEL